MEGQGVAPSTASLTQSLFIVFGMIGGFGIMRFIDRIGPIRCTGAADDSAVSLRDPDGNARCTCWAR